MLEYKGLCYGMNRNGDYVVLPHGVRDIDSPHTIHIAAPSNRLTDKQKELKAKEHIDFITTLEEGYEHIAGHDGLQPERTSREIPETSWWAKIENGVVYIAETKIAPDGLSYLRPGKKEWKTATREQIQRLSQLPLMKII